MKLIYQKTILFFFYLCCLTIIAQPSNNTTLGSVKGKVIDKNLNQPISYASIIVSDNTNKIITGGITAEDGAFSILNIPSGNYTLKVEFIGYADHGQTIIISKENKNIDIGTIFLYEGAEALDDVTIIAERTTIEQKIDRKVINIGKDLTTTGGSAAEIMNNIQSVNVDKDGNISLRGNQNVRILIDGKPTNMDAAQLLKQIPSTSIKKIELITNPSAKYNPEGMSGIINIVLHKNSNNGLNGTINLGFNYEENTRFNSSIDLNYKTGKINVYGNYGNKISKTHHHGNVLIKNDSSNQEFDFLDNAKSHLYKIGVDYFINDHNTVSLYTNQNVYKEKNNGSINNIFLNNDKENIYQNSLNQTRDNRSTYNFDYKHNFLKEDHSIELEVDYNVYESNDDDDFNFIGNTKFTNYKDIINNSRKNTTINLDYINPLTDKAKLELGYETRFRETDNTYQSTLYDDSRYSYDRNIHSFYSTYGKTFEKWSYQLGARLESYDVKAILNDAKIYEDNYITVYPSASISYNPAEKNSYQMSYSRRVDRPSLSQVNPIRQWSSPRVISLGNPSLNPQFTNSIEVNYTRKLNKGSITSGMFFRIVNDAINHTLKKNPEVKDGVIIIFDNFDSSTSYGFEISSNYNFTTWWSVNSSFDLYAQTEKGVVDKQSKEIDAVMYNFRINNSFKATKNLTFQVFGLYRGSEKGIQFNSKPFYFVNTGARYSFMKGKGTASINFNDIFKTQYYRFSGLTPYQTNGRFQAESQTVALGLSYQFGAGKNRKETRKQRDGNEKSDGGLL